MNESRQNRRRGRESRIKLADENEDDEEDERPTKRRKIANDDEYTQNNTNDEPSSNNLPLEVIGMVFDHLDLMYGLTRHFRAY
jgi:hypothetical protein